MLMMRFKQKAVVAALLLSGSFAAHADPTTYTFISVTGFANTTTGTLITGVLAGTSGSTTVTIPVGATGASCGDFFLRSMAAPGTYTITTVINVQPADPVFGGPFTTITSCSLNRNP
jgi:pectate lyase